MAPQKPQSDVHVEDLPRRLTLYNYKCVAFAAVGSIIYGYCLSAVATTLVRSLSPSSSRVELRDAGST